MSQKNQKESAKRHDLTGRRFGKLTALEMTGEKKNGYNVWRCRCDCGNETVVSQSNLMIGHTNSCGCLVDPSHTRTLIEGTCIESIRSKKLFVTNTSGVRGVYRVKKSGKWAAQIMFKGRQKYLGTFDTLQEAAAARQKAEHVYEEFLERYDNRNMDGEDSCSLDIGSPKIKKWTGISRHSAEQGLATSL